MGPCTLLLNVLKKLVNLFKNRNMAILVIFLLFSKFGFAPVLSSTSIKLVNEGFPKETIATISVCMFPFTILAALFVGKFLLRGYETTW